MTPSDIERKLNQAFQTTNYLTHISHKKKYMYVETPKVACTGVKHVLQCAEVGSIISRDAMGDVHNRALSPLLSPSSNIPKFYEIFQSNEYFKFAFVRNPIARALSCWLDKIVQNQYERHRLMPKLGLKQTEEVSFLKFLEIIADQNDNEHDIHWATQTFLLRPNIHRYSFIGRFENFNIDFEKVCKHLGMVEYLGTAHEGKWHSTSASTKIKKYVGERELALLHSIYEQDFRNFGFGWGTNVI